MRKCEHSWEKVTNYEYACIKCWAILERYRKVCSDLNKLTSDENKTYNKLRKKGHCHLDALEAALDGVDWRDVK